MKIERWVIAFFLLAVTGFAADAALADQTPGKASDSRIEQQVASAAEDEVGEAGRKKSKGAKRENREDELSKGERELEIERRGKKGVRKGAFTDSDGTGWNYCSGRCKKVVEKVPRAGGGKDNVLRITNLNCKCGCVVFKNIDGKLVKKAEIKGEKGYLNIGQENPNDYTKRCCEKE